MRNNVTLTVVLPIRVSEDRKDAIDRLGFVSMDSRLPQSIDFLVVDDGSPSTISVEIEERCGLLGYKYVRLDTESRAFSIGRARNAGAQCATSEYVLFQDIDLLPYEGFYNDVINEMYVRELDKYAERFLMFGVVYLTSEATDEYFNVHPGLRKSKFLQYFLEADKRRIEKFSTGTSVTLWRRCYFLSVGGNDPDFEGWGYEDLEFACRAIRRSKTFPLPDDYGLDYKNFQTILEYRGWKSVYRLFGDQTFSKGIVLFHAWHPVGDAGSYSKAKDRNRVLFEKKLREFAINGHEPPALPMLERGSTVIFRKNTWVNNRWILPFLGKVVLLDEEHFDAGSLYEYLIDRSVARVLFHNPYASERMLSFYKMVREKKFPFLVCERGALPRSVFFDQNGFNADSDSYSSKFWGRKLGGDEKGRLSEYIQNYRFEAMSLETQSAQIGSADLRRRLGIPLGGKVLFVPLQRPSDTVVKYFSSEVGGAEGFYSILKTLAHGLPRDWTLVVKKHPLEDVVPEIGGVVYANDSNIDDLLDICDAVFLINSGVGVLALMSYKPVFYCGEAFYGHDGVACKAISAQTVLESIDCFVPNREKIDAFLYYLIFELYSFGDFATREVSWVDGSRMTATVNIEYQSIRIPGFEEVFYERRKSPQIGSNSVLFDRYRNPGGDIRLKAGAPSQKNVAKSPSVNGLVNSLETLASTSPMLSLRPDAAPSELRAKRWKKFKREPRRFFVDSKNPIFRMIGKVFY